MVIPDLLRVSEEEFNGRIFKFKWLEDLLGLSGLLGFGRCWFLLELDGICDVWVVLPSVFWLLVVFVVVYVIPLVAILLLVGIFVPLITILVIVAVVLVVVVVSWFTVWFLHFFVDIFVS